MINTKAIEIFHDSNKKPKIYELLYKSIKSVKESCLDVSVNSNIE